MRAARVVVAERVVGRERELAALRQAWDRARAGRGGMVALAGEAGIGKTRLARAAADRAAESGPVLVGRAVATPARAAFRPLAEALCSAVRAGGLPDAAELAPFRGLLGRLIPEWSALAATETSLVALGEAVLRFLRVVAGGQGCLLVLEDLQWADPDTLAVLEYLADNITGERVCLLATVRDEDRGAGMDTVRRLVSRHACQLVDVGPLGHAEVSELAAECLGTPAVAGPVAELAQRAGGVPLLVEAMLLTAASEGVLVAGDGGWQLLGAGRAVVPVNFADSVRLRLATLDGTGRDVLRAAAVLGAFDIDLLAPTAGVEEADVPAALAAGAGCGLLVAGGDPPALRFRHALAGDAIAASLFPPERVALARRGLAAVTARRAGLPGEWCEVAADLARLAGEPSRAAGLLREIGRRARASGALTSAAAALRRAGESAAGDPAALAAVEEDLVEVLALAGDHAAAAEVGAALLGRLVAGPEVAARRALVRLRLARAAAAASRWDEARRQLDAARSEAGAGDRLGSRADALDAVIAVGEDDPVRACRFAERARVVAEREGLTEVACEALEVLGRCRRPEDLDAAEAAFADSLALATRHGLGVWRVRALCELGIVDLLRAVDLRRLTAARDLAAELGALATEAAIELHLCAGLLLRGEWAASQAAAGRAAELARRYGMRHLQAAALGFSALVHANRGDGAATARTLAEAAPLADGDASFPATAGCASAMLAFVADDRAAAVAHLDVAGAGDGAQVRSQNPAASWRALLRAVDPDGAVVVAEARRDGEPVNVVARGFLRYADAVVAGRAGREGDALAAVEDGDRLLGELTWLRHFGLRWVSDAAVADGWGRPQAWLTASEAFFADAGQQRLAAACRSLLRRVGVPVRRPRAGDAAVPDALRRAGVTGREFEVLALLAEGLPNAAIAQRLYLSPRTVERHIANMCAKVGVERRAQLVALAARTC